MQITLEYFDGCPNWETADARLRSVVREAGVDADIRHELIETSEAAERRDFRGSPTVLIDGVDPFAQPDAPIGLGCRIYETEVGRAGSPTKQQLAHAIARATG